MISRWDEEWLLEGLWMAFLEKVLKDDKDDKIKSGFAQVFLQMLFDSAKSYRLALY